jgi:hypothetical protein
MYHNSTSHRVSTPQICQTYAGYAWLLSFYGTVYLCVNVILFLMEATGLWLAFTTKAVYDPLGTWVGRDLDLLLHANRGSVPNPHAAID